MLAALLVGFPGPAAAGGDLGIKEIVVFGASASDVGNVNILTAGSEDLVPFTQPPYFEGRFSNGPLWHEVMAEQLGVMPASTPSLAGGGNFAFGGAEVGPGGSFGFGLPNLGVQIDWYLTGVNPFVGVPDRPPAEPSADQLFILASGGGNNLIPPGAPQEPETVVAFIEDHVTTLAAAGGRRFLVTNFFDIEKAPFLTPLFLDPVLYAPGILTEADAEEILVRSRQINRRLRLALWRLERRLDRQYGDVTIIHFDKFRISRFVSRLPQLFGIEDTTGQALTPPFPGCFCTGIEADNPDAFFWYDSIHPTAVVHHVWGEVAAFQVRRELR